LTVDVPDLRNRVGAILMVEETKPTDWATVETLTDKLLHEIMQEPETSCPEIVNHYLDDLDIRASDEQYAKQQRDRVRLFVETGHYKDSTPVPLWTCAVGVVGVVAIFAWLLW